MSDTWTLAAIVDELRDTIQGGRVQQIVQTNLDSLALEIYAGGQRHYLLVAANRQQPRLHLLSYKPRRGTDAPSPILQLARKFIRGSRMAAIEQPPWERILHLKFEHPQHGSTILVAELIGRWANLLLLRPIQRGEDAGELRILGCIHRVRPSDTAARTVLPGQIYVPPPAQSGWSPATLTELRLRLLLEEADPQALLWRTLLAGLQGFSPLLAREVVYRATGDVQTRSNALPRLKPVLDVVAEFVALMEEGAWQPGVVVDTAGRIVAFAGYPLRHRLEAEGQNWQPVASISLAAERFYAGSQKQLPARPGRDAESLSPEDAYATARQEVARHIEQARRKLQRRRQAIERELRPAGEIERLRLAGEWILALATQIQPRQTELSLAEAGVEGLETVALDPALSPAENAAAYFKRYKKAKRASEAAAQRLAEVEAELSYLEQLAADLALAVDRNEIDAVRVALVESGHLRLPGARIVSQPKGPRRYTSREGYAILVGRNSRQNEQLTFRLATASDLWLHARDWPGSHVIIRNDGRPVSEETLRQAAELAAFYSRGRQEAWVDVVITERRRVRRAPGKRPGMVTVRDERVLRVRPREAERQS